jgi:hypothetical protein
MRVKDQPTLAPFVLDNQVSYSCLVTAIPVQTVCPQHIQIDNGAVKAARDSSGTGNVLTHYPLGIERNLSVWEREVPGIALPGYLFQFPSAFFDVTPEPLGRDRAAREVAESMARQLVAIPQQFVQINSPKLFAQVVRSIHHPCRRVIRTPNPMRAKYLSTGRERGPGKVIKRKRDDGTADPQLRFPFAHGRDKLAPHRAQLAFH